MIPALKSAGIEGREITPIPQFGKDGPYEQANRYSEAVRWGAMELDHHRPDVVLLQGDRVEVAAIATAAKLLDIPIAHLYGGDISGNIDSVFRDVITRLADIHFPSTHEAWLRLITFPFISPKDVFRMGDPVFDIINRLKDEPAQKQSRILVLQHPEWPCETGFLEQISSTLEAALNFENMNVVIVKGGRDVGWQTFEEAYRTVQEQHPDVPVHEGLEFEDFLRLMRDSAVCVGNSSSFLAEAPVFKTPCVIVGGRQKGRIRGNNCVDSDYHWVSVMDAIDFALSEGEWRENFLDGESPYDIYHDMKNSERIAAEVKNFLDAPA